MFSVFSFLHLVFVDDSTRIITGTHSLQDTRTISTYNISSRRNLRSVIEE
jgi:hypothetical protein